MRELFREFVVGKHRAEEARDRDVALAWHTEMFARQKTLPSLASLLRKTQAPRPQTLKEQHTMLQILSTQYGLPLRQVARG